MRRSTHTVVLVRAAAFRAATLCAAGLCLALLLYSASAFAQDSGVAELARRLRSGSDFRVRTQAALALGASGSARAVVPLCRGLNDPSQSVRAAAAAALGKLRKGGLKCLQRRIRSEGHEAVRAALRRAVVQLSHPDAFALKPGTRLVVQLGETKQEGPLAAPLAARHASASLAASFRALEDAVVAPPEAAEASILQALAGHDEVRALYLLPKIQVRDSDGTLRLELEVTLFVLEGRTLLGTARKKLAMPDTRASDQASLRELIEMAARGMAADIRKTASRI